MTKHYSNGMDHGVKIEKLNGFSDVAGTNSSISSTNFIDSLSDLFYRGRSVAYGKGEVSMCGHMLQTAELAAEAGAAPPLLVACLLHDVGHFGTDYPLYFDNETHSHMQTASQDLHHEEAGASMLRPFFGPDVIEPIRLHVAAKRYLCATDPDYAVQLSTTTLHTLGLQGGVLDDAKAQAFLDRPYSHDAVQLRRWDDAAMTEARSVPGIEHYMDLLEKLFIQAKE